MSFVFVSDRKPISRRYCFTSGFTVESPYGLFTAGGKKVNRDISCVPFICFLSLASLMFLLPEKLMEFTFTFLPLLIVNVIISEFAGEATCSSFIFIVTFWYPLSP